MNPQRERIPSAAPRAPAGAALPRVFVLGDSISIHYGPHLKQMLAGRFHYARKSGDEAAMRNLDIPAGANGGDSNRCLKFLTAVRDTTGLDADLLLLNCGLHDLLTDPATKRQQVGLDRYRENLAQIVHVGRDLAGGLLWVRTTPVDEARHNREGETANRYARDVGRYNAAADEVMAHYGIDTIDLFAFTSSLGPPAELLYDGRHFHEPIRRLQAAYLAGRLDAWRTAHRDRS